MAKLVVDGTTEFDPFGIPWLKNNRHFHKEYDLAKLEAGEQVAFHNGLFTVGISLAEEGDAAEADIKVAIAGMPFFDKKLTLDAHIGAGPESVNVGGPQLGFIGTVQVVQDVAA
jgi:hypothetical protein